MSKILLKNNSRTFLRENISPVDTIIPIVDGSVFPVIDSPDNIFYVTFQWGNDIEIVKVLSVGTDVLNVQRGQEDTLPMSFYADRPEETKVELRLTSKVIRDLLYENNYFNIDEDTGEVTVKGVGGYITATISYDNTISELSATNIKDAIDELDSKLDTITQPLLFKGAINVASDFPTLADVKVGWFYKIQTNVTDNDVTKTNTGASFTAGEDVVWGETGAWVVVGVDNRASDILFTPLANHILSTNVQDAIEEVEGHVDTLRDTVEGNGIINGMALSIASPTTFSISAGTYYSTSKHLPVAYSGATSSVTYLLTHLVSYIAIDPTNNSIIQKSSPFIPSERRQYIILGALVHSNKTTLNAVNNLPDVAVAGLAQQHDFYDALSGFNKNGNIISPNGANLSINKSAGCIFKRGVGFQSDPSSPNEILLPALVAPTNIRHRLSTGVEYGDTDSILTSWESTVGNISTIPGGSFSVLRIYLFPSNLIRVQLGRVLYNSMANALQGYTSELFETEQNLAENGLLRAYLIIRGGTTDLSDSSRARFIETDKFGALPVGGSAGTTNLQQAYNNSVEPEIATDAIHGAVTVQIGSGSDYDNAFEVKDTAGTVTAAIDGKGSLLNNQTLTAKDMTGIPAEIRGNFTLDYNHATRVMTLTRIADWYYYCKGKKVDITSTITVAAHTNAYGVYFYYFDDDTGVVKNGTTAWNIATAAPISLVIYNPNALSPIKGWALEERHGMRDLGWHENQHFAEGTKYISGFNIADYTLATDTVAATTWSVGQGTMMDEDLKTITTPLPDNGPYTILFQEADNKWNWITGSATPYHIINNNITYNPVGGTLTEVTGNNEWFSLYAVAVPAVSATFQNIIMVGKQKYASLVLAQAENFSIEFTRESFLPEYVPVGQFFFRRANAYSTTTGRSIIDDFRYIRGLVTVAGGSPINSLPASNITVASAGFSKYLSVLDDTVQKALTTLDQLNITAAVSTDTTLVGTGEVLSPLGVNTTVVPLKNTSNTFTSTNNFSSTATVAFQRATGTSPFTVSSSTLVSNLNAQYVNGLDSAHLLNIGNATGTLSMDRIATGTITDVKLASNSVTTAKIADLNVTEGKLATSAVTAGKLASDSVTTVKILNANVTADKLASNSVTTVKITDLNVTDAKIATVSASKIVGTGTLPDGVLSTNIPRKNEANVFTSILTIGSGTISGTARQLNLTNSGGNEVGIRFERTVTGQHDWEIVNSGGSFNFAHSADTGVFDTVLSFSSDRTGTFNNPVILNSITNNSTTIATRMASTSSATTQIPVFTADPATTTRTLVTRTPAQLRGDIGAEPSFSKNTAFNSNFSTVATDIKMNGTQALGVLSTLARADHVHPSDTSKANTNQTMYIGTTAVTINRASATLNLAGLGTVAGTSFNSITGLANSNPLVNGTVAIGTSTLVARQDHVHPVDTSRAASSHTHGNITNAGLIGTTANLPIITGTGGILQAGSFGTGANTFCQGNDARLSDARTPLAHSHNTSDITAGTLGVSRGGTGATTFTSGNVLVGAGTSSVTTISRSGIDTRTSFPSSWSTLSGIPDASSSSSGIITTGDQSFAGRKAFVDGAQLGPSGGAHPYIKIKYLSVNTGPNQGDVRAVLHGLDLDRVISIDATLNDGVQKIPPGWQYTTGYQYNIKIDSTQFYVELQPFSSSGITNKNVICVIMYTVL